MGVITIIGTGWQAGQLTLEAAEALRSGGKIIMHTARCGCAAWWFVRGGKTFRAWMVFGAVTLSLLCLY